MARASRATREGADQTRPVRKEPRTLTVEEERGEPRRDEAPPVGVPWVRIAIFALVLAGAALLAWRLGLFKLRHPAVLAAAVERARDTAWIGPIFVAVYAGAGSMALPVSPLAYGAGAVFGTMRASLFVWLASMVAATVGYWTARALGGGKTRALIQRRYGSAVRDLRSHRGFLHVLRLQLLPVIPFGLMNYAAAIAGVRFLPFILATGIAIIPGTVAAAYVGAQVMAGIAGTEHRALLYAAAVGLLIILLSFAPTLMKRMRKTRH